MNLSIIIVSWNTKDLLKQCLLSVEVAARHYQHEVFVVDNASNDGSACIVQVGFPKVKLISNSSNLGFAAANNQALRLCTGKYALLLNPDTVLLQECLTQLITFAEQNKKAGAIGAKLLKADGSPQGFDRGHFPTKRLLFNQAFFLSSLLPRSRCFQAPFLYGNPIHPMQVDWVAGTCLLLRKKAIEDVGLLDDRIFMYGEDQELCWRLRRAGWKVYYHANATIVHFYGQSLIKQENSFLRRKTRGWSGPSSSQSGLSNIEKMIVISGLLLRWAIYFSLYLITRQPELKRKYSLMWKLIVIG